ncbi:radical SAM protein [Paenibacillus sp. M1]|uniref:Radical SAM protein n=1 Tax=Paenibacillus haidiansis TaxID=1574488 RepID=A0ABU7VPE6_9BACL
MYRMITGHYVCSKYNYRVITDDPDQIYLFNCLKGSFIKLPRSVGILLDSISKDNPLLIDDHSAASSSVVGALLEGGFIVRQDSDELSIIEEKYNSAVASQTFSVTIATTLNCNLSCYYCYQEHSAIQLNREICDRILFHIEQRLTQGNYKKLIVDWYGGEPLLALESIEYLSKKLIGLTSNLHIDYKASMVTNGTRLTPAVVDSLDKLQVSSIQITLDGPPSIHNNNRPYRGGKPSFDSVLNGIQAAAKKIDTFIRINVNQETLPAAYELLDRLADLHLSSNGRKVVPYISMIGPLSSACGSLNDETIPVGEFYANALNFQKEVLRRFPNLEVEDVVEIPKSIRRACGAQNPNSLCIHPSGQVFKCGLDIHDSSLGASYIWDDYDHHSNFGRWHNLSPLKINECIDCRFLPLCMGGCAKHNFIEGHFYERESCLHWNTYLDSILKTIIELKKESV